MQLYNSKSQQKEQFFPRENEVRLYVCGITPYDTTHLGHAFTYTTFDTLIRYFEWKNVTVRYVQNVTDIDDDILKRGKQVGKDWRALGNEWTRHFIDDMLALNVRPPDEYPRATEMIPDIIELTGEMIARGAAYVSNGSVYFDVDAFPAFGELSHIPRPDMLAVANERGNHPEDPNKRNPLDFVLWQSKAEGEPAWSSPWGEGRPGWHIECTAMVNRFLGPSIDIHGGGGDLIFPHHECEIAQSVSATGVFPFARDWMHTAMLRYDGEKMSKSLGNLVWASDLLKDYTPDAVRLCLAGHHYRDAWEYKHGDMIESAEMAERWRNAAQGASLLTTRLERVQQDFSEAMEDDLNSPLAIVVLDRLAQKIINGSLLADELGAARATLRECAAVLGLTLGQPVAERVTAGWNRHRRKFED